MSDIITRLLLKTDGFDANLKNSKQSVNSFQNDVLGVAKNAAAGIAKFAGGIGLAIGAVDGLTKIMGSQQATQDEWDNNVFAAKLTVDKFFTSINNGDWTSFQDGFIQSLAAAKNLSAEIDALNDKRLSLTYIKSESLSKIEENKAVATDTTQPIEVRRKAFAEMQKEREALEKKTNETIKKETDVLIKTLNVKYGELGWTEGDVIEFVVDTNFTGGGADFAAYKEQLAGLQSKEKKTTYIAGGVMAGTSTVTTDKEAVERTKQFKQQNIYLEKQRILEQEIDETRKKTVNLLSQQANERRELASLAKAENRIEKQLTKGGGTGGAGGAGVPAPPGSLAYFDAEIAKKNKELINATTTQARAAVQVTINELEAKKLNLKIRVEKDVFETVHGEMKGGELKLPNARDIDALNEMSVNRSIIGWYEQTIAQKETELSKATDAEASSLIQSEIKKLKGLLSEFNKLQESSGLKSGGAYSAFENNSEDKGGNELDFKKQTEGMKLPKFKSPISKGDIDINRQYTESLGGIGAAFGSMGQMATQFGSDGMTFALNSVGSIAQMIMQLQSLATANGVASAMSLPFPANLGAIATVVGTVASIFSSLPAFENGGIVPGVSYTGDKVHALVNSGEMILNGGQQSNLFRMLNSGLHASITAKQVQPSVGNVSRFIMPDESDRKIQVFGDFRIKGCDLELAIKNQTNRKSKVR